jgi:hypothetical protein
MFDSASLDNIAHGHDGWRGQFKGIVVVGSDFFYLVFHSVRYPLDVLTNDIYTIIRRNATTISHEMVAGFTGKYESSMSLAFEAVIWSIHKAQ